jgi:hypothetical protein
MVLPFPAGFSEPVYARSDPTLVHARTQRYWYDDLLNVYLVRRSFYGMLAELP